MKLIQFNKTELEADCNEYMHLRTCTTQKNEKIKR